jgi:hypothetical protein
MALEGFQNADSRGGAVIFVDESAKSVSALNCPDSRWVGCVGRFGCEQGESSMRAVAVVMDRVTAEYVLEVAAAAAAFGRAPPGRDDPTLRTRDASLGERVSAADVATRAVRRLLRTRRAGHRQATATEPKTRDRRSTRASADAPRAPLSASRESWNRGFETPQAAAGLDAFLLHAETPQPASECDQAIREPAPCSSFAVGNRPASEQPA